MRLFLASSLGEEQPTCLNIFSNQEFYVVGEGTVFLRGSLYCKNLNAGIQTEPG